MGGGWGSDVECSGVTWGIRIGCCLASVKRRPGERFPLDNRQKGWNLGAG